MVVLRFDCCLFTQKTAGSTKGEIQAGIQGLDSAVHTTYNQRAPRTARARRLLKVETRSSQEIPNGSSELS